MATIKDGKGTFALATFDKQAKLAKHEFGRPAPGSDDVALDIHYCGMCHSDLHACNGDWGIDSFPIAPGHEIAGIVTAVGDNVSSYKVGQRVAVGCFVDSCKQDDCEQCSTGLEQHCTKIIQTYSSTYPEFGGHPEATGYHTNGGYSTAITVHQRFVFAVPEKMKMEVAGPLLCSGITMYSPLNRHVKGKSGRRVGIVGFGGLGHIGVKIAKAMGAEVFVFSRNNAKEEQAKALGAKLLVHSDKKALQAAARSLDVILDTVSAEHEIMPLVTTLKPTGSYVLIGGVAAPVKVDTMALLFNRYKVEGSLVGGVPETAEMLEFCAANDIEPTYDIIHAKDADEHFRKLEQGKVGARRAVIDISTIKEL
mmetsp:Transcript_3356/g.4155  ORF Transcript_3356/g.4155 Transcript_3356/m.4155 type:complete len:366 (-) Transcript_3356:37-1134(-)|eukprot:CAMPEP_0206193774 /NCGR_PEP_ID=MMETSP0166-20121206/6779_1 /ASSEMBLY_ACC=CAM_ASM_000260 /TAXON_ID=95228 /ORGANISM="Vannella robusta, Strain DIVA3 518/3/11/1/6" /LENGTH=365 /DNA_ID=CAMNT_0053610575 /DNA_START=46 /DNA_END=1143 /DNA_ORIENTATION=-